MGSNDGLWHDVKSPMYSESGSKYKCLNLLIGSKSIMLISLSMLPMLVSAKTILILGDSISAGY